ncbi:hypothetical protein ACP5PY_06130 [Photobacterium leiognathi subsp. mandapamensis]
MLVCRDESKVNWQLDLSNKDAKELEHLIESAQEDYEILMRDLQLSSNPGEWFGGSICDFAK